MHTQNLQLILTELESWEVYYKTKSSRIQPDLARIVSVELWFILKNVSESATLQVFHQIRWLHLGLPFLPDILTVTTAKT